MRRFLASLRFLTILPVPGSSGTSEDDLAGAPVFFPLVGLLIGLFCAALAFGLSVVLPPLPCAAVSVVLLIAASGGLHIDGLSDTADGFLSSRPRDGILEIMKDSRAGPMGAMAIACLLLVKVASLGSLPEAVLWRAVLLMPVAGRGVLVIGMGMLPYARAEGGLGTAFYGRRRGLPAVWAGLAVPLAGWLVAGPCGLVGAAASLVVTVLFAGITYRKIGGSTGDTLGAGCELAEAAQALAMAAWCFNAGAGT